MRYSIQARLLGLSLGAVLAVGLTTVWIAYQRAMHEVDELVDAQLVQYVRVMLVLAHEDADDEVRPPNIQGHPYAGRLLFQIWQRDDGRDRLLLRSPEAPAAWPTGVARKGYSVAHIGARDWRCFVVADGKRTALAALDVEIRGELARGIAKGNLKPYLYGLPILALLLALVIRHGLAPLRRLEADLSSRSPEQLDPLPEAGAPRELSPLIGTMNRLFGRMRQTLDNERRFTSDAAHELRTPLAALKVQLQVAQRTPDAEERGSSIGKALRGADRMTHLVAQLLALARLEGSRTLADMVSVPLSTLLEEAADEMRAAAAERGIHLETVIEPGLERAGNPGLLRVLARNLLDNALRYVPTGGRVRLALAREGDRIVLKVADDGPGVAAEEREKLGLRFHRFGPQTAEGVGLGLSIVRRIAELHGAELAFGEGVDGRGLGVEVRFPDPLL